MSGAYSFLEAKSKFFLIKTMTISRKLFYNKFHVTLFLSTLILLSGGIMQASVTGKRENKRGNGLELPCKVTVKAPFFIYSIQK